MTDEVYHRIVPSGSRAGVLYGLPKIHKPDVPVRPIISAVGTYNYKLAKYLVEILSPLIDDKYILKDTFDFVNKVSNLDPSTDKYMFSYDVVSLFTNIPTLETIEIILDSIYTKNVTFFHNLKRIDLKNLLVVCTQKSHFQFNGEYYDQVDGVSMGSPLGPLFANFFMSHFEITHMEKLKEFGINLWLRYVDDVFSTAESREDAEKCLEYINGLHPNIKFTIEHELDNKLPFLDTCVQRRVGKYVTTVYHKATFTGVYLNWNSLTARRYKIGLIKCLTNRILRICTEEDDILVELAKLEHLLQLNNYPLHIVKEEMEKTVKIHKKQQQTEKDKSKNTRFLVLPYVNRKCEDFAHRIRHLVNSNFADMDFNVAFQTPRTIGNLFPFKDKIKLNVEKSMLVYRISCKQCDADYIGKTKRILFHRVKEHQAKGSACYIHASTNPGHEMNYESIEVIDQASNDLKLRIKELLHILKRKPSLNKQLNSQSDFDIKTLIIQAYPQFRNLN